MSKLEEAKRLKDLIVPGNRRDGWRHPEQVEESRGKKSREQKELEKAADELEDIHEQMHDLLEDAKDLLQRMGTKVHFRRAKSYWLAHIQSSLGGRGGNPHDISMQDTIDELREGDDD